MIPPVDTGKRIARHYVIDKQMDPEMLIGEVKKVKELCGETVSISTHYVETKDGIEKLTYIDETLRKYGRLSVTELVNITHVIGGPWDSVDKTTLYTEIPDSIILERHYRECIA